MGILTAREFKARQDWVKKHLMYVAVPAVDAMQGGSNSAEVASPPDAPVISIDSYPDSTSVIITWAAVDGATNYNAYIDGELYSDSAGSLFITLPLVLGVDTDIYVTATGAGGESDPSNTVTANSYAFYYLYDTFTGTNGTALSSHSPEQGGPWTNTGVLEIQSNKAKVLSGAPTRNFAFSTVPVATANGYMQADLTVVGNGDLGIIINVQDVDHLWMIWKSAGNVILYEQTSKESFTSRGSYASAVTTLKAIANGDTIEVWINGVLRITYTVGSRPYKSNAVSGLMFFSLVPSGSSIDNAIAGA